MPRLDASHAPALIAVWAAIAAGGSVVLALIRTPAAKRLAHRYLLLGTGVLFLTGVGLLSNSPRDLLLIAPVVVLIMALNLRYTLVCDSCGAFAYPRYFVKPKYCAKCGAQLKGLRP